MLFNRGGGGDLRILITLFWMLSRRLIGKLAEARLWIEQMATTDDLTGVFNRGSLFEHLEGEFDRARRLGHGMSCILLWTSTTSSASTTPTDTSWGTRCSRGWPRASGDPSGSTTCSGATGARSSWS
jgi:hypothetical protein